jgi:hypothetical protein
MAVVLKTVPLGSAGKERQDGIQAIQSLDRRFFINAENG